MKKFIVCIFTLASLYASANCGKLEGDWFTQQEVNGVTYNLTLTFSDDGVTATHYCRKGSKTLMAQVKSAATFTDFAITTKQTKHAQKSDGDLQCEVSLQAETAGYNIVGNLVVIASSKNNSQLVLMKR